MLNGIFFAQALLRVIRRTILFSESPSDVFGFSAFLSLPYFDLIDAMFRQFRPAWNGAACIANHQGEILEKAAFKYCVSGLVLCAAAASVSAFAAAPTNDGWYLGTSVGRSKVKINRDNLANDFKGNKTGTGFKLYGGYQFNQYFALEGQYINLATAKYQSSAPSTPWHSTLKMHGFAFDAVGILPLGDSFALLGKAGLVQMVEKANMQTNSGSWYSGTTTKTTPLIGVGAEYKLTPALALRAEYEYFGSFTPREDSAAKIKTDMLSVGMRYTF